MGGAGGFVKVAITETDDGSAKLQHGGVPGDGDQRPGPAGIEKHPAKGLEGFRIETIQGLVEQEKARVINNGAGEEEAGTLDGSQGTSTELERGFQPAGHREEIVEETHITEGIADFIETNVETAKADVVEGGAGNDVVVSDEGDVLAEGFKGPLPDVDAIDLDMAIGGRTESVQEVQDRTGAASEGCNQGGAGAWGEVEGEVGEQGMMGAVLERDIGNGDMRGGCGTARGFAAGTFDGQVNEVA